MRRARYQIVFKARSINLRIMLLDKESMVMSSSSLKVAKQLLLRKMIKELKRLCFIIRITITLAS